MLIDDYISYDAFKQLDAVKNDSTFILSPVSGHITDELTKTVITGIATIKNKEMLCIAFDKTHKMGAIGVAEGEKITLAFEYATQKRLPIVAIVASGGIKVDEGTTALMQMVKMTVAVKQHSEEGLLYIVIITNPTLGGASASFVSLADIIVAEKGAVYGFSGRRIIEKTTNEQLPYDFQTAEYAKRHGMVDIVSDKTATKQLIPKLLRIYGQ